MWLRWTITGLLVIFVALAATNQFGQSPSTRESPPGRRPQRQHARPPPRRPDLPVAGRVTAHSAIAHPTIGLSGGWFTA